MSHMVSHADVCEACANIHNIYRMMTIPLSSIYRGNEYGLAMQNANDPRETSKDLALTIYIYTESCDIDIFIQIVRTTRPHPFPPPPLQHDVKRGNFRFSRVLGDGQELPIYAYDFRHTSCFNDPIRHTLYFLIR